jgi:prolyl 4-hydroxylase
MYLNDVEEGGETYFHTHDMAVKPKTGRAIVWWNLTEDGTRDASTYHEGRPVKSGLKYICTKWIRERQFR